MNKERQHFWTIVTWVMVGIVSIFTIAVLLMMYMATKRMYITPSAYYYETVEHTQKKQVKGNQELQEALEIINRSGTVSKEQEETIMYASDEYISEELYDDNGNPYQLFYPPEEQTSFKAYMGYKTITDKNSPQYKMQQQAWTDENGLRRYGEEGYYMVAMGTYYAPKCGRVFRITLESGEQFTCIIGDIKSNVHTDATHRHRDGNVIEFIVDTSKLSKTVKKTGDISSVSEQFEGKIKVMELLSDAN